MFCLHQIQMLVDLGTSHTNVGVCVNVSEHGQPFEANPPPLGGPRPATKPPRPSRSSTLLLAISVVDHLCCWPRVAISLSRWHRRLGRRIGETGRPPSQQPILSWSGLELRAPEPRHGGAREADFPMGTTLAGCQTAKFRATMIVVSPVHSVEGEIVSETLATPPEPAAHISSPVSLADTVALAHEFPLSSRNCYSNRAGTSCFFSEKNPQPVLLPTAQQ